MEWGGNSMEALRSSITLDWTLMEKRSWSTSGFIGGHHRNLAGTLVCQLSVFRVLVIGGHQHAILEIEGTCASGKLLQNLRARSIKLVHGVNIPGSPPCQLPLLATSVCSCACTWNRSWPVCKVDESRNMIWSLWFSCVRGALFVQSPGA